MWIKRLRLRNFKGFDSFEIELHRQLTVIAGVNGAGKTSVLDGLAVAMGAWFLGFDDAPARSISMNEVRVAEHVAQAQGATQRTFERQYPVEVEADGALDAAGLYWKRAKRSDSGTTTRTDAGQLTDLATAHQAAVRDGSPIDLPLLAYYGTGRLWAASAPRANEPARLSRTAGYRDALNPRSDQAHFSRWMMWRQLQQLQRHRQTQQLAVDAGLGADAADFIAGAVGPEEDDPWLAAVERAVVGCVEGARRFYFSVEHQALVFELSAGQTLPFAALSDGYRNLIATVADIAWRAAGLNPAHGGSAPREATGIVLIDEIELHLHPAWQLQVLPRLLDTFPKVQFVVTTHAPLVIASVDAQHVRFLDRDSQVRTVQVAGGLSANSVLRKLMGVPERDEKTAAALAALGRCLEAGDVVAARQQFDALQRLSYVDRSQKPRST